MIAAYVVRLRVAPAGEDGQRGLALQLLQQAPEEASERRLGEQLSTLTKH